MKKPAKIVLGILSFMPIFLFALFFLSFFYMMINAPQMHPAFGPCNAHRPGPPPEFFLIFVFEILMFLFNFGMIIFYVIHLLSSSVASTSEKIAWTLLLLFLNFLAFPVYWYLYIWKEPKPAAPPEKFESGKIYCQKCGMQQDYNNYACSACGFILHHAPEAGSRYEPIGAIIPYKNKSALIGYYLGVFSLIPFVGIVLGALAFIFGLKGRRLAIEHPEVRGSVHAWIGIILGGLCFLGYSLLSVYVWSRFQGL